MTPQKRSNAPVVEAWRRRLLDQVCGIGALVLGAMMIFGAADIEFGVSPIRDVFVIGSPIALAFAVLWRSAPYLLRCLAFLSALFCLETLGATEYGFVVGTILSGLLAVGLTGLLLGARWAIAGWALSTGILLLSGVLVNAGWLQVPYDPSAVDPRDLRVAMRFSLTYGAFSAFLAMGVYFVVERLSSSLRETQRALAQATYARSEKAQAEAAKRAAEAAFRSVVEHAPDSIAIVDRDHVVVSANHQAQDPDSQNPSPVGRRAEDLVVPSSAERVRSGIDAVFAGGEPQAYDIQVPIEGRPVWYASRVGPIVEDGRVDRVIVVTTDISERLHLEEQLLQAQKLEAVGQLTGGVAHDFNNLLTVILGNLQLVSSSLPDADPSRTFVENARDAARRGSALTHRLLAFGRKQALQPRVLDLGVLVAGMDDLLRRTLGATVRVRSKTEPDLWKCRIDPTQVENLVLNLAINARDAMPNGGEILIETSNVVVGEGTENLVAGEYVMLSLTDDGIGMDREVLAHAFEPFYTTKGLGRGSGLGLSTVYGFVKQSGGDVEIESEPGQGTCVRVQLPRSVEPEETPRASQPSAGNALAPQGSGELILVVEDDPNVRSLTVNLLERVGYKTVEAGDAQAALVVLSREPGVALVFTDVVLPGEMSGLQLAQQIRVLRPGLPLLFTSGYLEDAIGVELPSHTALVEKPFTSRILAERIREALTSPES